VRKIVCFVTLAILFATPALADMDLHGTTWVSYGGSDACGIRSLKFTDDRTLTSVTVEAVWQVGGAQWSWKDGKLVLDFDQWDATFTGTPNGDTRIDAVFHWTPQGGYERVDHCIFEKQ
jgi:hypothetical protein